MPISAHNFLVNGMKVWQRAGDEGLKPSQRELLSRHLVHVERLPAQSTAGDLMDGKGTEKRDDVSR